MSNLILNTEHELAKRLEFIPSHMFDEFEQFCKDWYTITDERTNNIPVISDHWSDVIPESLFDDAYDLIITAFREEYIHNSVDNDLPKDINDWEEEHFEECDESLSDQWASMVSNLHYDMLIYFDAMKITYLHKEKFFWYFVSEDRVRCCNDPICEVW